MHWSTTMAERAFAVRLHAADYRADHVGPHRTARGRTKVLSRSTLDVMGAGLSKGLLALGAGLLVAFPVSSATADTKPSPPRASVEKGTYFTKKFQTRIRAPGDGWTTKRVILRGHGVRRAVTGKSLRVALKPGRYKVTRIYYALKRPRSKVKLKSLPNTAVVAYEGSVRILQVGHRSYWEWDPLLATNKGVGYLNQWFDPAPYANETGGRLLGKLACLKSDLGKYYYQDGPDYYDRVLVSLDDPRIYEPPEGSKWYPDRDSSAPAVEGRLHWRESSAPSLDACFDYAFRIVQTPADYDYKYNYWSYALELPDGNWIQKTEEYPTQFGWEGTATARLPNGWTYQGAVSAAAADSEPAAAAAKRYGYLQLQPRRGTNRTKRVSGHIIIRAVNAGWASQAEVNAIKIGMTKSTVNRIIGSNGRRAIRAPVTEVRQWYGKWGDLVLTIGFRNGQVASLVY